MNDQPVIKWNEKQIMQLVLKASNDAMKEGAEIVEKSAKQILRANIKKTEKSTSKGKLESHISTRESKFKDGGYIVGVFGENFEPWEKTIGAQSIFVEFGHASPYQGRKYKHRKDIVKHIPARPFMRKALRKNERKILRLFNKKLAESINP